jgi:AcrR family transcriptional regulator
MATRATQFRILQAALELFNEHGTAAVSSNRIAERCGISKGNLQYHFRNKREIIYAVFQQAIGEMDAGWYRDHLAPTLEHMAAMFVRQLQLILKYRFFYRTGGPHLFLVPLRPLGETALLRRFPQGDRLQSHPVYGRCPGRGVAPVWL